MDLLLQLKNNYYAVRICLQLLTALFQIKLYPFFNVAICIIAAYLHSAGDPAPAECKYGTRCLRGVGHIA